MVHQIGDLLLGEIGVDQRKDLIRQGVQLLQTQTFGLAHGGLDHAALALHPVPVGVDAAQTGEAEGQCTVQVVDSLREVVLEILIDGPGLHLGKLHIDAAHSVDDLNKGFKVHLDIAGHIQQEIVPEKAEHVFRAGPAKGVGQQIDVVIRHGDHDAPLKAG